MEIQIILIFILFLFFSRWNVQNLLSVCALSCSAPRLPAPTDGKKTKGMKKIIKIKYPKASKAQFYREKEQIISVRAALTVHTEVLALPLLSSQVQLAAAVIFCGFSCAPSGLCLLHGSARLGSARLGSAHPYVHARAWIVHARTRTEMHNHMLSWGCFYCLSLHIMSNKGLLRLYFMVIIFLLHGS